MESQSLPMVPPTFGGSALSPIEYRRKLVMAIKNYNDTLANSPAVSVAPPLTDSTQAMNLHAIPSHNK